MHRSAFRCVASDANGSGRGFESWSAGRANVLGRETQSFESRLLLLQEGRAVFNFSRAAGEVGRLNDREGDFGCS